MKHDFLTDKMLQEIFAKLAKGETFTYSDDETQMTVSPNGISIQYHTSSEVSRKEKEVDEFLMFCEDMDDELFIEVCESFKDGELAKIQELLDTDEYRNAIRTFVTRAREIANNHMTEITNAADAEITRNEKIIEEARKNIELIHRDLDIAHDKYAF